MTSKNDFQPFDSDEEYVVHGVPYRIEQVKKYWLVESIGSNPVKIEVPIFFPFVPGKVNLLESFNAHYTYGQLLIHLALKQEYGEPIRSGQSPVKFEVCHV